MSEEEDEETIPHWVQSPEQHCRAWVLEYMATPDIDGKILVENMDLIVKWLMNGDLPAKPEEKPKSRLKVVSE